MPGSRPSIFWKLCDFLTTRSNVWNVYKRLLLNYTRVCFNISPFPPFIRSCGALKSLSLVHSSQVVVHWSLYLWSTHHKLWCIEFSISGPFITSCCALKSLSLVPFIRSCGALNSLSLVPFIRSCSALNSLSLVPFITSCYICIVQIQELFPKFWHKGIDNKKNFDTCHTPTDCVWLSCYLQMDVSVLK